MNLVDELYAITGALESAGVAYAVCGGVAVTVYGVTRSTKDIDLLIEPTSTERVVEVLRALGYTFRALPQVFDEGTPSECHVERVTKVDGDQHLVVDLLQASHALSGMLDDTRAFDLPNGTIRVVAKTSLIAMKRLSGRQQDLADIEQLEGLG